MTLLERIQAAQKGPTEEPVPEWGLTLWLRVWSVAERLALLAWYGTATDAERQAEHWARVLVVSAVDEAGATVFPDHQTVLDLRHPDALAVVRRLAKVATRLNGLAPDQEGEKEPDKSGTGGV